jgi:hypothetical protein
MAEEDKVPLNQFVDELVSTLDARLTKQDRHVSNLLDRMETIENTILREMKEVRKEEKKETPELGTLESKLEFWHRRHDADMQDVLNRIDKVSGATVSASLLGKLEE